MATGAENVRDFSGKLPKAELHLHLEGSLTVADVFAIAHDNELRHLISHKTEDDAHSARVFEDLQGFLDELSAACAVLMKESDYYHVTKAYLTAAAAPPNNVKYAEIQVGPQEHTVRGVSVEAILRGMNRAMAECEASVGIVSRIIITLIKSNTAEDCEAHLEQVLALGNPAHYRIIAAGLAGPEIGYHHSKFSKLMERARAAGLAVITHAGEEGGPEYVADALDSIRAQRIDHGVQAAHDPDLCKRLITENVGLCVCPISNEKLQVYKRFFDGEHPLRALIESGVKVCLGSDDPAFFGGYISDVYCRAAEASSLTKLELWHLAKNSFELALGLPKDHPVVVKALAELEEMKPLE